MQRVTITIAIALLTAWCQAGCGSTDTAGGLDASPVVTLSPVVPPGTDASLARALAARRAGEYEVALAAFREILAHDPTVAGAYVGIGEIYLMRQDYADAEGVLARAVRLESRNFDAQYGHGRALQMLGRFAEAVRAYHRALTIRPDSVDANRHMATTYLQMGEPAGALVFAEKAVELDPANGPARANLGTIYREAGRSSDAIHQYEAAIELMEATPPLLTNLITALVDQERYVDAMNAAEDLVTLAPSAQSWERLGWSAFRAGNYRKSIEAYRDAVAIEPDFWPALNGVGCNALNTWLSSGKRDGPAFLEAREAFRRSVRVNPDQQKVISLLSQYGSR